MLWVHNKQADSKIRHYLWNLSQLQKKEPCEFWFTLLEFTGMLEEEFERWCAEGIVSDRYLRCERIPFDVAELATPDEVCSTHISRRVPGR